MARGNPALAGAMTWLVNPRDYDDAAELAFGRVFDREEDVELKLTKSAGAGGGKKIRKNAGGLDVLVAYLLPIAAGGGLGVLDGLNPRWWARIGYPARAFVLVAVTIVARKRDEREMAGGASALAGRYIALWASRKARVALADKKAGAGDAAGDAADQNALGALGPDVNAELVAAADALAAGLAQRGLPQPQADFGAIPMHEVRTGFNEVFIAANAA